MGQPSYPLIGRRSEQWMRVHTCTSARVRVRARTHRERERLCAGESHAGALWAPHPVVTKSTESMCLVAVTNSDITLWTTCQSALMRFERERETRIKAL